MTPWVARIIFATFLAFVVTWRQPALTWLGILVPELILRRPWTPFTYMLLHADFWHVFFNMLGLFFFGPRLEAQIGSGRFITLYVLSGLGGALLSLLTPQAHIVGASAATFGVFFGYVRFWPHDKVLIWGLVPVETRILLLLYTAFSVFGGLRGGGGIAHWAHLGGYGAAYLYFLWLEHRSPSKQFRRKVEEAAALKLDAEPQWSAIKREGLHPLNLEELDRLQEKTRTHGVASLTLEEQAFLRRLSG